MLQKLQQQYLPRQRNVPFLLPEFLWSHYRSARRAETRPCPICDEIIPLRLLSKHLELETERVEEIISNVGSTEPILQAEFEEGFVQASIFHLINLSVGRVVVAQLLELESLSNAWNPLP